MKNTLDLLRRYKGTDSDATIAARLGVERTAIVMARKAGRLSPHMTMRVAEALGEPVAPWMAIAAAEAAKEPERTAMLRKVAALFALGVVGLLTLAAPYSADANPTPSRIGLLGIMSTALLLFLYGATRSHPVMRHRTTPAGRTA